MTSLIHHEAHNLHILTPVTSNSRSIFLIHDPLYTRIYQDPQVRLKQTPYRFPSLHKPTSPSPPSHVYLFSILPLLPYIYLPTHPPPNHLPTTPNFPAQTLQPIPHTHHIFPLPPPHVGNHPAHPQRGFARGAFPGAPYASRAAV